MAIRLDIRPRLDLRSAKREKQGAGGLRLAWGVSAYWVAGLSLAYAMHAGWLPVRDWLQVAWRQGPAEPPALLAPVEPPATPRVVPPPALDQDDGDRDDSDRDDSYQDDSYQDDSEQPAESEPEREAAEGSPAPESAPATEPAPPRDEASARSELPEAKPARRRARRASHDDTPAQPSRNSERPAKKKRRVSKPDRKGSQRTASTGGGSSCEAAVAGYREEIKLGTSRPADLTSGQLGAVLNSGRYFAHCGVPPTTAVRICAAVQGGRAVGVTVSTDPPSGAVNRCVAGAVRGLSFPSHPLMDVTTTTFAADH